DSLGTPRTNFDVARLKRDVFRRSSIGLLVTQRSASLTGRGSNQLYGVDGSFTFFDNLHVTTYAAKTETRGLSGSDMSYRGLLDYEGDRYGLQLDRLVVGQSFNPEAGFLQRQNFRQWLFSPRFSPRPKHNKLVRRFNYMGTVNYITD